MEFPARRDLDQTSMWNAYGHVLGAATGLELTLRIALLEAVRTHPTADEGEKNRLRSRIRKLTFGGTAKKFMGVFPAFAANPNFRDSLEKAVRFRNHLAHHFLEAHLDGLQSETGLALVELECRIAVDHFRWIAEAVQRFSPLLPDEFFKGRAEKAGAWERAHPLRNRFDDLQRGGQPIRDGLAWWQG